VWFTVVERALRRRRGPCHSVLESVNSRPSVVLCRYAARTSDPTAQNLATGKGGKKGKGKGKKAGGAKKKKKK